MKITTVPRRRRLAASVAVLAVTVAAAPAGAVPIDRDASAASAASWVASKQAADGSINEGFSTVVGNTIQAGLGLAAVEEEPSAFEAAADFVAANHTDYVFDAEGNPQPGALGYTALLAVAAGDDPRNYGTAGTDLVAQIQASEQEGGDDDGLYGTGTVYDRSFNHSLAMLGLAAAAVQPSADAIDWLEDQQCTDGGFASYRSPDQRAAGTCEFVPGDGDPSTFPPPKSTTPDTNTSAVAIQALTAVDASAGTGEAWDPQAALGYLVATQNEDGGWAYQPGFGTDATSTGLVVQAINALGGDPAGPTWVDENQDGPFTALRALQFGCEAPAEQRGAFFFPPFDDSAPAPDGGSTYGALYGLGGTPFPFPVVTFDDDAPWTCPDVITDREGGEDRFATAALLANDAYAAGTDTVVIANGLTYADALAGAPLARQLDAPILLVAPDVLPDVVAATVNDLGATKAVVLGGDRAVSPAVVDALVARTSVTQDGIDRIGGDTRFATAALVAARVGGEHVYVVEGIDEDPLRGWPDALAVSPLAAFQGRAVLLVATDVLPEETREALQGKSSATVVGGPVAVSEAVESAIDEVAGDVARVFGESRYGTSLALSRLAREAGMDATETWIATGSSFPDGLAAGPIVAKYGGLFALVPQDISVSGATQTFIHETNTELTELAIVGGRDAVSPETVAAYLDRAR